MCICVNTSCILQILAIKDSRVSNYRFEIKIRYYQESFFFVCTFFKKTKKREGKEIYNI